MSTPIAASRRDFLRSLADAITAGAQEYSIPGTRRLLLTFLRPLRYVYVYKSTTAGSVETVADGSPSIEVCGTLRLYGGRLAIQSCNSVHHQVAVHIVCSQAPN